MDFVRKGKKIVAIGENYLGHIKELNGSAPSQVMFFLKPVSSYLKSPATILIPKARLVHHEIEFGCIIGKTGRDIKKSEALEHVSGYALALDLTTRDEQNVARKIGYPWTVCKGYDHFTPVGEFIPKEKIPDPNNVQIWAKVNGSFRQNDNTSNMIFKLPDLISEVSKVMTLEEGDLLITGTPEGVGPIVKGDKINAGLSYNGKTLSEISFDVDLRE
ncbi:hypothetical protein BB561_003195 [Smittium simulii]|uniref:Fumarylacetoacetase-like C-terminal domain-containing protein n=1 Tax=Smittium simulii TaxID=133385 RepID=A0A2T9YMH7_9FUNG|nr:hypothetical protein BB561_003195 [Smittium simulii]